MKLKDRIMGTIEVIMTEKLKCKALKILFIVLPELRRASFENVDELNGDILAFFKRHSIEYKYGSPWQISWKTLSAILRMKLD